MISGYQTFYNYTGDEDFLKIIEDIIETCREKVSKNKLLHHLIPVQIHIHKISCICK